MKYKKLKELITKSFELRNGESISFNFEQDITIRDNFYRTHKISAKNEKEEEVGSIKIVYVDKNAFNKSYDSQPYGDLLFASDYSIVNENISKNFYKNNKMEITHDDLNEIVFGLYSSTDYDKASRMSDDIDELETQKELDNFFLTLKDAIKEKISKMKDMIKITSVAIPKVEYIVTTDKLEGYRGQGIGLELYKVASQWMGANNLKLYAGQLNEKSKWLWENKLSKIKDFNFKEKEIIFNDLEEVKQVKNMNSIVRYDGKIKLKKTCKVK
jgi:hypothetical protein